MLKQTKGSLDWTGFGICKKKEKKKEKSTVIDFNGIMKASQCCSRIYDHLAYFFHFSFSGLITLQIQYPFIVGFHYLQTQRAKLPTDVNTKPLPALAKTCEVHLQHLC